MINVIQEMTAKATVSIHYIQKFPWMLWDSVKPFPELHNPLNTACDGTMKVAKWC
jgi:hypothetical protein